MSDLDAAIERRSLPEVAKYQDWEMPYDTERAAEIMAKLVKMDGPENDSGWQATVVDRAEPDRILGDVYVGIEWDGRSAELGFTFHPDYWGKGYASEAAQAMVRYLFIDEGVSRVRSSLHPDNPPSARVLESCGMIYEGLTRQSFWVGDECSDDMLYGMTRADWEAWIERPRHRPEKVELVEVTVDNADEVGELATHKTQERFVATMALNFQDALIFSNRPGSTLWYRAIEADGDIVGFIMTKEMSESQANPYVGRLLIDRMHQRRGIGSVALDIYEQRCRELGATAVDVAWAEGPGSPGPMYMGRGYEPTGEVIDGEVQAVKQLG